MTIHDTLNNEIEITPKRLHATGRVAWIISIAVVILVTVYGWSALLGPGAEITALAKDNEIEHNEFRNAAERNRECLKDLDAKMDLLIQLIREKK